MFHSVSFSKEDVAAIGFPGPVTLRDLGHVVVLAGPNGAGKTRLLKHIQNAIAQGQHDRFEASESTRALMPRASIHGPAEHLFPPMIGYALNPSLPDALAQRMANVEHQANRNPDSAKVRAEFGEIESRVKSVMSRRINFQIPGEKPVLYLDDSPVSEDRLSPGEQRLLGWAITPSTASGNIVFYDEPEIHLHPAACAKHLRAIVESLPKEGQLWIATHSPALVIEFASDSLYLVRDGMVEFVGPNLGKLLDELLGGPAGRQVMWEAVASAEEAAAYRFAAQSLSAPEAAGGSPGDPGATQLRKVISTHSQANPLRVLEYGAGRGRLLRGLVWQADRELVQRIAYFVFDETAHSHLSDRLACDRARDDLSRLGCVETARLDAAGSREVDLVVLCNVLHEVHATRWESCIRAATVGLVDTGHLLVMEVTPLPSGELPHKDGYLVLSYSEMAELFGRETIDCSIHKHPYALHACLVPKNAIHGVSHRNVVSAVMAVRDRSLSEVDRIRTSAERSPQASRAHTFYAIQVANAELALSRLQENSETG